MMKKQRKAASAKKDGAVTAKPVDSPQTLETSFAEIVDLIQQARQRALQAVNTGLIDLYLSADSTVGSGRELSLQESKEYREVAFDTVISYEPSHRPVQPNEKP
jgi:hypothetical protein